MFIDSSQWVEMTPNEATIRAGLRFGEKGTHTSRTIMLAELTDLLACVPDSARRKDYANSVIQENRLGKLTTSSRRLTNQRLGELYGLDPKIPIFRVLRRLWAIDTEGRPLLALLCALGRDPLLRATAPSVLTLEPGEELLRGKLIQAIKESTRERLNDSIVDKVARNAGSSWTQSGHLTGRMRKLRRQVDPTPGALAFAFWLGSLFGLTGEELLATPWTSVFDGPPQALMDVALRAKQLRLIDVRIGGGVVEIDPARLDPLMEVSGR